ncbi:MAG: HAMP domain-containing histidine kinase [Armatimonadetes bacterium]|nr:HAMP domain-containing histidine kinase [Armatimonadota bacterium]
MRFSLKWKFILAFVGLTLLFAGTFGTLAAYRLRRALTEQVRLRAKVVAEEFAREASRFIATPEGQTEVPVSSRLTRRLVAGTVLYAQIVRGGTLRFTDGRADLVPSVGPLDRPFLLVERTTPAGTPFLDLFRAIPEHTLDKQTYVRIGFPLADVYARIRRETSFIILASLLLVTAGTVAAFVLQRTILGPAERMTAAIRHLQRGDYSARVRARTNDELQLLADEFNAMASAIESRDRELAAMNEALAKANRIKDDFSAAMSHELKTPLHAIRAYAQLVLEGIDGPVTAAQRRSLESLLAAGDHLLHLIEGILRYSALETGGTAPMMQEVDAAVVVEQARQNVAHLARAKGLPIATRIDGAAVRADETMLRQILINLLHNAIKYTERGQISVTTSAQNGQVLFAIADTGPGIPAEDAGEVFEPFRRAGDAARREIDGIGLGLAVARRYVELHGGRIWFESAAGGGTTFCFTLPRGRSEGGGDGGEA